MAESIDFVQKTVDGKNYCTFEYVLTSVNFARAAFATIAVGNGIHTPSLSLSLHMVLSIILKLLREKYDFGIVNGLKKLC